VWVNSLVIKELKNSQQRAAKNLETVSSVVFDVVKHSDNPKKALYNSYIKVVKCG